MPDPKEMMTRDQSRLSFLRQFLANEGGRVDLLERRVAGLGPMESLKPSLFARLKDFLLQIVGLKRKEARVIEEIEEIERRHAALKKQNRLLHASDKPRPHPANDAESDASPEEDEDETPHRFGVGSLFALFLLFMANEQNKKSGLKR